MNEYVVWGVPKGQKDEQLLFAQMPSGEPITDRKVAKNLKRIAELRFKATKVRIQTIDGTPPDFTGAVRRVR